MAAVADFGRYVEHDVDSRPRKKLRLSRVDCSKFRPGSLITVRLENFVTYTLTEFQLSPYLNMIIGPNGSGKSSFVCAVCLGLAGKPEYIGRSKKVEDYIKNGEDQGLIEIILKNSTAVSGIKEISPEDETIKVTRVLLRSKKHRSDYFINDMPVSANVVKELVSQLNIQLDNLCQFLSQERVEEFARLKPDKLLVETVRSIDVSLLAGLEQMIEKQNTELELQKDIDMKKQRLEALKSKKDKLEESVKAFKDFESKKEELENHSKLLPYVYIKDHKEKLHVYRNDYEEAKRLLKELLKDKKPFSNTKKVLEENVEKSEQQCMYHKEGLNSAKRELQHIFKELNNVREEITKKKRQNEYYRGRTKKIQARIAETRQEYEEKKSQLAQIELPDPQLLEELSTHSKELIEREAKINDKLSDIRQKEQMANHDISAIKREQEKRAQQLHTRDRIGILEQRPDFKEVKNAVLYIRSKPEMKEKVLEPPIMTVSAKHPQIAAYLAKCVDYNTSKALTVVDSASYDAFADDILAKYKVNIRELASYDTSVPVPTESLKEYGFEGYLSNFVTGDNNVVQMLCQFNRIHQIPISRRELNDEELRRLRVPGTNGKPIFRRIIHGNLIVDFMQSEYGAREIYSSDVRIEQTKFYRLSVLSDEQKNRINSDIETLKRRLNGKKAALDELSKDKRDLQRVIGDIHSESNKVNAEARRLNHIRKRHSELKATIGILEQKLETYKDEAKKDVSQKIKDVETDMARFLSDQAKLLNSVINITEQLKKKQKDLLSADIKHLEAKNLDVSMNDVIGFFNTKEEELKDEYTKKKEIVRQMRDTPEFKSWMEQIKLYDDASKVKLNEYAEKYEKEGTFDLKHIKDIVAKLESEISMMNHDELSVTLLEQVTKELAELEESLPKRMQIFSQLQTEIKTLRQSIEPKLDEVIHQISKRFSKLFMKVGSAGDVGLKKPHLFSEWNIEIKVKFRDDAPLKKLDSHTQSGGERAVSTVLYMIALQEFANSPFRVVDEINQGMDTRNERIVHKAMVENASAGVASQYFLVTPKLLNDLYYSEDMRIHCVMAGSWIPNPTENPEMVHFGQTSSYIL